MESTEIVKVEAEAESSVETAVNALMTFAGGLDDEDLGEKALELAQLTTPEIKGVEGGPRRSLPLINVRQPSSTSDIMPVDCRVGHFYDTNGVGLGEKVVFIPLLSHPLRRKWGEDSNIDCLSLDGKQGSRYGSCDACPYGRYEPGQKTECSKGTSFFVVKEDLTALYKLDFMKSSAKSGRKLLKMLMPPAMWSRSFELTSDKQTGQQNSTYYTYKVSPTGEKTPDEQMDLLDKIHDVFKAQWELAKARQRAFAAQLQQSEANTVPTTGVSTVDTDVDDDDSVIDFGSDTSDDA